jgi:hypothetical protein
VYPNSGTYNATARTVTFSSLDGKTDVLCTNVLEAFKGQTLLALTYSHMLARINVQIKAKSTADLEGIKIVWGKIKEITIANKGTGAIVTFPSPAGTGSATIAATGTGNLSLYTSSDTAPGEATLTATATDFGSALFVPSSSSEILTFSIRSGGGGTQSLSAPTKEYTSGNSYTVVISFGLDDDELEIEIEENDGGLDPFGDGGSSSIEIE